MTQLGRTADSVFGVTSEVNSESYVDRAGLDSKVSRELARGQRHISLVGPSKSGKSWLRQKIVPNGIVIQCRHGKAVDEIYREALGALGIELVLKKSTADSFSGHVESSISFGQELILKVRSKLGLGYTKTTTTESEPLSQKIDNLAFIAELLNESGRRLVIEDVHYLSHPEKVRLAYDLKALWDLGTRVVIIGIWAKQSLIDLNSDLGVRMREFQLSWSDAELTQILDQGTKPLRVILGDSVKGLLVKHAYGNAGILQALTLDTLDEAGFESSGLELFQVNNDSDFEDAAMRLAEDLNTLYQTFAKRTSSGIRKRKDSTGIYAHTMAVILSQDDDTLIKGIHVREIYSQAHARESRIQQPNLKSILPKLDQLQVDSEGRGLVVSYDEAREEVFVVDRQLLLYRAFSTVRWPWDDLLNESSDIAGALSADGGE